MSLSKTAAAAAPYDPSHSKVIRREQREQVLQTMLDRLEAKNAKYMEALSTAGMSAMGLIVVWEWMRAFVALAKALAPKDAITFLFAMSKARKRTSKVFETLATAAASAACACELVAALGAFKDAISERRGAVRLRYSLLPTTCSALDRSIQSAATSAEDIVHETYTPLVGVCNECKLHPLTTPIDELRLIPYCASRLEQSAHRIDFNRIADMMREYQEDEEDEEALLWPTLRAVATKVATVTTAADVQSIMKAHVQTVYDKYRALWDSAKTVSATDTRFVADSGNYVMYMMRGYSELSKE